MNTLKKKMVKAYRTELNKKVILDPYLLDIAIKNQDHFFLKGATHANYLKMVNFLNIFFKDKEILDWGSGKGHISYLLKKISKLIISCDVDSGHDDSSFFKQRPILDDHQIKVKKLDHYYKLPFDRNKFDLVTSFGVLEHVQSDEQSLRELSRVIKKNGYLYISFLPYRYSWTQNISHLLGNYYHERLYTKKKIIELIDNAGFEIIFLEHGQLFPKNKLPYYDLVEKFDRFLTCYTPLKYLATNLELLLKKK